MSNYLYGSSNVYRHYSRAVERGLFSSHNFELVKCTKKAVLEAHLLTIQSSELVVASLLENFVVDVCQDVTDEEVALFARQQITSVVEAFHALTRRLPDVAVVIMPPMYRSVPGWFGAHLPDLQHFLGAEVNRLGTNRIGTCAPFTVLPSMLMDDGIHLTTSAADRFLSHLENELKTLLLDVSSTPPPDTNEPSAARPQDDRLDQILQVVNRNSVQLDCFRSIGETVSSLTASTSDFESFVRRRFKNDDLIFARMKEESDADVNRSREDRVVITGLPAPSTKVTTHVEKKKHYLDLVGRLVLISCASADPMPKPVDVYINLRKEHGIPLVEIRFDSVSGAQFFRREGVRLAKANHDSFGSLFFSNSVTQSTRVRIEILRSLAKKLSTASETAFVQGFISRPVLQYRVKEGARSRADGVGRSYTFVDAMSKFGSKLAQKDLTSAYARAGNTFDGSLSQYFVVLTEYNSRLQSGSNRTPLGRRGNGSRFRSRGSFTPRGGRSLPLPADRGLKRSLDQLVSEVDLADEAEAEAVPPKRHEQDVIDGATTDYGSSSME